MSDPQATPPEPTQTPGITFVLVHGALTDASVWNGAAAILQANGHETIAPALPLRGLAAHADYLAAFLDSIEGPVVLAGHSYGGSVISHPRVDREAVRGLVFAAAFQPDADESTGELNGRFPGSRLGEATTIVRPCPGGNDLYLRPADFADVYAADVAPTTAALMAAAQRPIDPAALEETVGGTPTWRRIPSWTVISTADHSLPPDAQRFMAERAGSTAIEIDASHAVPVSRPDIVAEVLLGVAHHLTHS
jgi:pimeloyl-ACP methyl ester carboxylesterase